nr:hypothetical protein [Campylobacter jejuni]
MHLLYYLVLPNIDDNHIIFTWGYGEVANDILQVIKDVISLLQLTNKSRESFHINAY